MEKARLLAPKFLQMLRIHAIVGIIHVGQIFGYLIRAQSQLSCFVKLCLMRCDSILRSTSEYITMLLFSITCLFDNLLL